MLPDKKQTHTVLLLYLIYLRLDDCLTINKPYKIIVN